MKFETKVWLVTLFLIIVIEIFDEKLSFKEGFGGGGGGASARRREILPGGGGASARRREILPGGGGDMN